MNNKLDVLVTVDANYLEPLEVMLYSLHKNNSYTNVTIWLVHEDITNELLDNLVNKLKKINFELKSIQIGEDFFSNAPTMERYPREMYFRLLCGDILPNTLKRVLYLDPDILINNSIQALWEMDLEGNLMAAASHSGLSNITSGINNIRLDLEHDYFNSGIILIDLVKAREIIKSSDINAVIQKFGTYLLLPDQDVLNYLYGKYIKKIPEEKWNYDARKYNSYFAKSNAEFDVSWVMNNTAIIHFCGKPKPWQKYSDTKFTALYLHYAEETHRELKG